MRQETTAECSACDAEGQRKHRLSALPPHHSSCTCAGRERLDLFVGCGASVRGQWWAMPAVSSSELRG